MNESIRRIRGEEQPSLSWRSRLWPMVLIQAYLAITVLMFATSPWDYPVDNPWTLYGFLAAVHIALLLGYLKGAKHQPHAYIGHTSPTVLLTWSIAANLLLLYPTIISRTGGEFSTAAALADPGEAYRRAGEARLGGTIPLIEYFRIILGPLLGPALPMTVFYWRRLGLWGRLLGGTALGGTLVAYVLIGTNKAIADTAILVPCLLVAAHLAGLQRFRLRRSAIAGVLVVSLAAGFLVFFTRTQETREGSGAVHGYFAAIGRTANRDHPMLKNMPDIVQIGYLGLDGYLTQGYYALSLSLREPFEPMWGVGNSFFLTRQLARLTGDGSFERRAYPFRIEKYGWNAYGLWSSIYPWLASDVSFPGVIILVFFVGNLFARVWLDVLHASNPWAVVLFSNLVIMLFYFPANNQVLQSGEGLVTFFGCLAGWLATRSRSGMPSKLQRGEMRVRAA